MTEPRHDLLREPLIRLRSADGATVAATLPGVLARLGTDDVIAFPGLQPHQFHAWYAFLVQLAALASHRAGEAAPRATEEAWAARLSALVGGRREPWMLVVPDLALPAFFQPPVPEGTLTGFKAPTRHPDALDVLVTAKNHDVKMARVAAPSPEHWVYALVSLQTTQGFSGRDNYGVVRMNGGFGSRPCVAFAPGPHWGPRFRRDVEILLGDRPRLLAGGYGYPPEGGLALLWLEPWDGLTAIPIQRCDPFFLEVCRRVRLQEGDGGIVARTAPSRVKRIAAAEDTGDTGDPWTPIRLSDGAALTLDGSGFTYRRLHQLLFGGEYRLGAAAQVRPTDGDALLLVARAMVRGQGRTEGLHERAVPVPAHIRYRLGQPEARDALAALARRHVEQTATVDRKVLHPALCALLQGGPETIDFRDDRTRRWRDGFDAAVNQRFFEKLWEHAEIEDGLEAERRWAELLRELALAQLEDAVRSAPVPATRRYRAVAAAERVFHGALRKHFPHLYLRSERSTDEPVSRA
ncbi:MAG: type I-E CRISPR-associated protein Cse1/CasA [Acetobacteraceae bacterium]|nr:type I-E CRISPR-associated protein Cse1/CasA [Acetobacteraceae bacterium]